MNRINELIQKITPIKSSAIKDGNDTTKNIFVVRLDENNNSRIDVKKNIQLFSR